MEQMPRDPSDPAVTIAVADAMLRRLAVERARNDHAICAWLVRADELQVERVFGYGSIREYAERVFGFGPRAVEDRLRVGRALRDLPRLNTAFASGELPRYTTVRELCRVATPETEAEWIAVASGRTGTEVRQMVAAREPGDRPSDPGGTHDPDALVLLCSRHHEAVHGGALLVRGTFGAGFELAHADGRPYGSPAVDATRAARRKDAFEALRGMGFRERETRAMLDRIAGDVDVDLPALVRLALKHADVSRMACVREEVVPYARCG